MVRQQFFGSETNFELSTCAHFVISFHFLQLGVGVLLLVRLGSYFLDLAFNLPISWHWMTLSDAWQRRLPIQHNMAQWMLFNIDAGLNKAFRFGDNDSARIRWHLNITWNINKTQMISLICVPSMPNTITIHTTKCNRSPRCCESHLFWERQDNRENCKEKEVKRLGKFVTIHVSCMHELVQIKHLIKHYPN